MSIGDGFPIELLNQDVGERINYFNAFTISHPILKQVYEELVQSINNPGSKSFIFVYGPSGVGKTTLFSRLIKRVINDSLELLENDPGRLPIVGLRAIAPETGNFDWKDFYIRSLEACYEPLIKHKVDTTLPKNAPRKKEDVARELKRSLENTLRYRKPKAFLIDEAQHLTKMASGRKLRDQMDIIKSLAEESNVLFVLFGTYELLPFRNLSGQLSRRSADIHFPRYRINKAEDEQAFFNALWMLQRHMPFEEQPDLINNWEFFYLYSIGCIGILKDWLSRTYNANLLSNRFTITLEDFKKHAFSIDQCHKMVSESIEGEHQLEENEDKRRELMSLLGLNHQEEMEQQVVRKTKKAVGLRNPKRDLVGGIELAE
ncbi:AAA family ATPase [Brevibacillus porteri]|uniref:AAA family ATPase n=1 Tax=Brevibacillus porteri TaxID=2126350 RepID=UPI00370C7EE8